MDVGTLPIWAQHAATIAIAIVAAVTGVFSYLRKNNSEKPPLQTAQAAVVSASFIESRLLKELIEALREHQEEIGRDIKKLVRVAQEMQEITEVNTKAVEELTRTIIERNKK